MTDGANDALDETVDPAVVATRLARLGLPVDVIAVVYRCPNDECSHGKQTYGRDYMAALGKLPEGCHNCGTPYAAPPFVTTPEGLPAIPSPLAMLSATSGRFDVP